MFTPGVFQQLFASSPSSTKYFLERQTIEGFLARLKKGTYMLHTDPPSEEEIANVLYQPSYISFEYALAYYNVLPEMPYMLTSATTKPTRLFTVDVVDSVHESDTTDFTPFSYRTIKKTAYTGYRLVKKSDRSFLIADPEKALVDYLYFVSLKKTPLSERIFPIVKGRIERDKVKQYVSLYQHKALHVLVDRVLKNS